MQTKPRTEWNGLPGLLAAERMHGAGDRADFNLLDLGIDAQTLEEFLKEPIDAIVKKIKAMGEFRDNARGKDGEKQTPEALLTTLVIRTGKVLVMAERERVAEEERMKSGRRG